jgi:hypothetical protein
MAHGALEPSPEKRIRAPGDVDGTGCHGAIVPDRGWRAITPFG